VRRLPDVPNAVAGFAFSVTALFAGKTGYVNFLRGNTLLERGSTLFDLRARTGF
jgi:hypothetical protein